MVGKYTTLRTSSAKSVSDFTRPSNGGIIYPVFDSGKNYTLDPFWQDQFLSMACGKFPAGLRYDSSKNVIVIKPNGATKGEHMTLPENSEAEVFQFMMNIMKHKLGLKSTRDIKIQRDALASERGQVLITETEYKKIKPKHLKEQLMMQYILSLKSRYHLSPKELKQLISSIRMGFQFKCLSVEKVIYTDGVVKGIKGLKFNSKSRKFSIPPFPRSVTKTDYKPLANKFHTSLEKYLKENKARVAKFI